MTSTSSGSAAPTYDQLWQPDLLRRAWRLVQQGGPAGGIDLVSLDAFARQAGSELVRIAGELRERRYRFQPVRCTLIRKLSGGHRRLGIPTISDRIVQQAMRVILEPLAESTFAAGSFAYRPGRSVHSAVDRLLTLRGQGRCWFLESDVQDFFDTIGHPRLLGLLTRYLDCKELLNLIRQFLESGARHGKRLLAASHGVPQGSPLSPLLSNVYLHPFDQQFDRRGLALVRYADDFVVACENEASADCALNEVQQYLKKLGLRINRAKTRILDTRCQSLEFLGFLVHPRYLWPTPANVERFRSTIDQLTEPAGDLPLKELIEQLNPLVRSFAHYYRHCQVTRLFAQLDAHIRRRLVPHVERARWRRPRSQDQWRALKLVSMTEILFSHAHEQLTPRADGYWGPKGLWQPRCTVAKPKRPVPERR